MDVTLYAGADAVVATNSETAIHATLGCAAGAASGTGCAGGALGGAVSAAFSPDLIRAIDPTGAPLDAGQKALLASFATLSEGSLAAVADIATDPSILETVQSNGRIVKNGTVNGIDIRVVIESPGKGGGIVTAFPTNVPRTP